MTSFSLRPFSCLCHRPMISSVSPCRGVGGGGAHRVYDRCGRPSAILPSDEEKMNIFLKKQKKLKNADTKKISAFEGKQAEGPMALRGQLYGGEVTSPAQTYRSSAKITSNTPQTPSSHTWGPWCPHVGLWDSTGEGVWYLNKDANSH